MAGKKQKQERMFERHEGELPINLSSGSSSVFKQQIMNNISLGGLSFRGNAYIEIGTPVRIKAKTIENLPIVEGKVVWCKRNRNSYNVGVEFNEPEAKFGVRILEQLFHIENYRSVVKRKEGRLLSREEAAQEWIRKYAGSQ